MILNLDGTYSDNENETKRLRSNSGLNSRNADSLSNQNRSSGKKVIPSDGVKFLDFRSWFSSIIKTSLPTSRIRRVTKFEKRKRSFERASKFFPFMLVVFFYVQTQTQSRPDSMTKYVVETFFRFPNYNDKYIIYQQWMRCYWSKMPNIDKIQDKRPFSQSLCTQYPVSNSLEFNNHPYVYILYVEIFIYF